MRKKRNEFLPALLELPLLVFFVKEIEGQRCLKVNPHSVRQGISYSYEFRGKAIKYELDPTLYYNDKRNTFFKDFLMRCFYESNGDQVLFEEKLKAENIEFRNVCGYDVIEEEPRPGMQIQNVNAIGLKKLINDIEF